MRSFSFFGAFLVVAGCSGTQSTVDDAGSDGSNGDGSANNDAGDSATSGDSSNGDSAPTDAGSCADEHGAYSVSLSGQGCGNTSTQVKECIKQVGCTITLSSISTSSAKGLDGTTPIEGDGSFTNAAINEGNQARTGCTGVWNESTGVLVVDCGGTDAGQSCIATLTRTGSSCN